MEGMKVTVIGGGPAGLGTAILLAYMGAQVNVHERLQPDQGRGFGLTLHEEMANYLHKIYPPAYRKCEKTFCPPYKQQVIVVGDQAGFSPYPGPLTGVKRNVVMDALRDAAKDFEIPIHYGVDVDADFVQKAKEESDLVIGADGRHSIVRETFQERFQPQEIVSKTPYLWFDLDRAVQIFVNSYAAFQDGVAFIHVWPDSPDTSSGYLEYSSPNGNPLQAEDGGISESHLEELSDLFSFALLEGKMEPRGSTWKTFSTIQSKTSYLGNVVLVGDAYETVHFHTGAGMQYAFYGAKTLALYFAEEKGNIPRAIKRYHNTISKSYKRNFQRTLRDISKNDRLWRDWKRCGSPKKFFEFLCGDTKPLNQEALLNLAN